MGETCSKEHLPQGPWTEDIEKYPERVYEFPSNGYACKIVRQKGWNWNGYITLPLTHPDYGKNYNDIDVHVHGGLTFSENGRFGFDCAHLTTDIIPIHFYLNKKDPVLFPLFDGPRFCSQTFKDFEFVKKEVESMATQFKNRETLKLDDDS